MIDKAIRSGDLAIAATLARDFQRENHKPVPLWIARHMLPLICEQRPAAYDASASRFFVRWLQESPAPRIHRASAIAFALSRLQLPSVTKAEVERAMLILIREGM